MNVENLKKSYPDLLAYMKANGYSVNYVRHIKTSIMRVLEECAIPEINSYDDYFLVLQRKFSDNQLRGAINTLSVIRQFDLYGEYPDSSRHYGFLKRNNKYSKLCSEFKQVIDNFMHLNTYDERSANNIKLTTINFLYYLQEKGYSSMDNIEEKHVLSYFYDKGKVIRGVRLLQSIKTVLKMQPDDTSKKYEVFVSKLPKMVKHKRCYPALEQNEVTMIKTALDTYNPNINLREKAITTLALQTGIRACDISKLTFSNIDWNKDLLTFTQSKTGIEVTLPLLPDVGNAIFEYITTERPQSEQPFLFLTETGTPRQLRPAQISSIAAKFMVKAGVRVNGGKKGIHLYRHNLAISLLNNNNPSPVIMKVLGHTCAEAMEGYLETDYQRLKACALSIEPFSKYWKEVML